MNKNSYETHSWEDDTRTLRRQCKRCGLTIDPVKIFLINEEKGENGVYEYLASLPECENLTNENWDSQQVTGGK